MPPTEALSLDAVHRLPPMLFGRIRWDKGLGAAIGDPCSGCTVLVEEHAGRRERGHPPGRAWVPAHDGLIAPWALQRRPWRPRTGSCRRMPAPGRVP
jgi:hypothetical protein